MHPVTGLQLGPDQYLFQKFFEDVKLQQIQIILLSILTIKHLVVVVILEIIVVQFQVLILKHQEI